MRRGHETSQSGKNTAVTNDMLAYCASHQCLTFKMLHNDHPLQTIWPHLGNIKH